MSGSIALYLELVGESKGIVIAELQFSLLCHGTKLVSVDDDGRITDTSITFNAEVASRAFKDIITKGELEKPEYLEDDTILVRCDITVANELSVERRDLEELDLLLCDCNDDVHLHAGSSKKKVSQSHVMAQDMSSHSASTITMTTSIGCHVVKLSGYS